MLKKQMKYFLSLIVSIASICVVYGQPICYFEHFSSDNGLPQNTVMDIGPEIF